MLRTFATLLRHEFALSVRNMNMVIFAVILPLVVLAILGFLYGDAPSAADPERSFLEQSVGALCAISICAGGLMGLPLVVSEYRERKILKRFRVTPVSPVMLLAVEFAVYVIYAAVSLATLVVAAGVLWGAHLHGSPLAFAGSWLLTTASTLSIGVLVGGIAKDAKTASVIACVLYFPMLAFSGATVPLEVMPQALQDVVQLFPLTQGIRLMQASFTGSPIGEAWVPVLVMACVAAVCFAVAALRFKWE